MNNGKSSSMRFERELKSHAEPVSKDDLNEGSIYFFVNFVDEEMLIPTVDTVVYVGRDLEPGDAGQVYFQDIHSFQEGIRYDTPDDENYAEFQCGSENELGHVFEFERALDVLSACSLRRRKRDPKVP
jgi:hypothetical protein